MSGEVVSAAGRQELQEGPQGSAAEGGPFTAHQLSRIDEALTLSSRETGLNFSVYVGEFKPPARAHAEALFERLDDSSVLVAVSPGQRVLHIVTGPESAKRLPNRACALAALAMRASFANGDLVGGIATGLRMLADAAGTR
ncbi:MAG: hypothetical protein QOI15_679 [Pseudonocardiales bacterium]|nr:hypothetical protein [Pseudonocardiales bacterium]MDT4919777.1 hypothetical protein [Pseudonocardiales bacterium]MDT4940577.1 hypothetical protein [Pseudonocardiales bacterium]